ncbi:MAG: anti-sigma factor [Dehalococcoidia bacterium]|nr:anti-sigma factor [Dehalococcoidia bacterium]
MKCQEVNKRLLAYLDGELTSGERQEIKSHLDTCLQCRQELESASATVNQLQQAFEVATMEAVPSPQVWARIKQKLSTEEKLNPVIPDRRKSRKRGTIIMIKNFIWRQPKWRIAITGAMVLTLIVALALILPSSPGKPGTALAAEIALNSPEVKAALGGGEVKAIQATISEGEGLVVCVADMQPPIIVKVDLKSRKVTEITDAPLPELTEAETKAAIDIAKSDPTAQIMLDKMGETLGQTVSITSAKAFPCFVSGTVETKGGEIKLLPKPRMAIVEFELSKNLGLNLIRVTVDLDAQRVIEAGIYSDQDAKNPNIGISVAVPTDSGQPPTDEEAKIVARGLINEDPIFKALLNQGFSILDDRIIVFRSDNRLDTEKGGSVVISTPGSAIMEITKGEEKWIVMVDLVQKQIRWVQIPEARITPIDPVQDAKDRELVLNLLQNDPQAKALMDQGAVLYIQLHRGDFEYAPSPDTGTFGVRPRTNATVYLILGDDLWGCDIDLKAGKLDGAIEQMPDYYRIPAEKKEAVMQILEAEPKVRELLGGGGQLIYIMGGGDSESIYMSMSIIYVEKTGDFWEAVVSLDNMKFLGLDILD